MLERTKEQIETIKNNSQSIIDIVSQRMIRDNSTDNQEAIAYEVIDLVESMVEYDLQKCVAKNINKTIQGKAQASIKKYFDLMY